MDSSKKKFAPLIILALLAVFNVIVFSMPITRTPVFWFIYALTSAAVVLLGAYLLGLISLGRKAEVQKPREEVKPTKFFLNTIQVYVNVLNMKNKNEELAVELRGLLDVINGSEPVSCASIEKVEEDIKAEFGKLQKLVEQGKTEEAKDSCRRIRAMLEDRNSICKKVMGN